MYLIKIESYKSDDPLYMKLQDEGMFIPEARVARDYFNSGLYEKNFINWSLENYAREDKEIIDIGAHIGLYTIPFGKKCKKVHSFECSPKSFNYLCANIALNKLDYNVNKYNVALSDNFGKTNYYIRDEKDGGGNGISKFDYDQKNNVRCIEVETKTLDCYQLENINFIKIDVEGHEEQVLRGSVQTIKNNNYPKILFESWSIDKEEIGYPAKELRKKLFSFVLSLGYKIIQLSHDMYLAER